MVTRKAAFRALASALALGSLPPAPLRAAAVEVQRRSRLCLEYRLSIEKRGFYGSKWTIKTWLSESKTHAFIWADPYLCYL